MDKFLFCGRRLFIQWCWLSKGWWTLGSFSFGGSLIKLPVFVIQRAVAPKTVVEFHQKSTGALRCSLATSYNDWRRRVMTMKLTGTDRQTGGRTDKPRYWEACASKNRAQYANNWLREVQKWEKSKFLIDFSCNKTTKNQRVFKIFLEIFFYMVYILQWY